MDAIKQLVNDALKPLLSEISREDMPQIKGKDLPEMLKIFDEYEIPYSEGSVSCGELSATQEDYSPEKKQSIIDGLKAGNDLNPIVISSDGFIIDGHHRWLAAKELWGDSFKMSVIQLGLPKAEALKLFDDVSDEINEATDKPKFVVVFAGRFQPPHIGHYQTYEIAGKKFDPKHTYMATSNKVEPPRSPFSFKEKQEILTTMFRVPSKHIIQVKNPYVPTEVLKQYDPEKDIFVAVMSPKDAKRLANGKYFKPFKGTKEFEPFGERGYYLSIPKPEVQLAGKDISGSGLRQIFGSDEVDDADKKKVFKKIYGKFNQRIYDLITKKLTEQTEIVLSKETIAEFFMENDIKKLLTEVSQARDGGVDDGPATFYRNLQHYKKDSKDIAEILGFKIIAYMVSKDDIQDSKDLNFVDKIVYRYNIVPVISYGSAGSTKKLASTYEKYPTRRYMNFISRVVATNVGYKILDWMGVTRYGVEGGINVDVPEIYTRDKTLKKSQNLMKPFRKDIDDDFVPDIKENINISNEIKSLINEGGAFGHLAHPFDDWNLTFGDLYKMIEAALEGKLEIAREKTDGSNLMFSWRNDRGLVVARNKSHLRNFGKDALDLKSLTNMFSGRGEIQDAFVYAMQDLQSAVSKLTQKQKDKIFKNGKKFMSVEVIYPQTTNVIPYGFSMLLFQDSFEYDEKGTIIDQNIREDARILAGMIKQINQDVQKNFRLGDIPKLKLSAVGDFSKKKTEYFNKLKKLQKEFNLRDTDEVSVYHQEWWKNFIQKQADKMKYSIPNHVLVDLTKRWAFGDKSFSINQMKKEIDNKEFLDWAVKYDKNDHEKQMRDNLRPFEQLFLQLGVDVMKNLNQLLAANPNEALDQIRKNFDKTIKDLEKTDDVSKITEFKRQLTRLEAIGGIDVVMPSEGITFMYKGGLYKITGAFAPLNRILGLLKF